MITIEDMFKKIVSIVAFGLPINVTLLALIEKPLIFTTELHLSLVSAMLAAAWLKQMGGWFKDEP